jgi:hypothetical protein
MMVLKMLMGFSSLRTFSELTLCSLKSSLHDGANRSDLLTGQNPASSEPAANALLDRLALQELEHMPDENEPWPLPIL